MSNVQFTAVTVKDTGQQFLTVLAADRLLPPVDSTHPNFDTIKDACQRAFDGEVIDTDWLIGLFDVAQTVADRFARLSERVSVRNGVILLDGDVVHGTLQDQILSFLDQGEDFAPLVNFYEKLLTNPLGDVREGLYSWIQGQSASGNFTITPDGDIVGYKSVRSATPEWRTEEETVYVPSRRGEGTVNGIDVPNDKYIEQVPGDSVEMPRSRVLHEPSQACGDGLHIGTWGYASTFRNGGCNTVMAVRFSPRDIVSLPDSTADWKLRVCRYTVIGQVDQPLSEAVYHDAVQEFADDLDLSLDTEAGEFREGDRVEDADGDQGVVTEVIDGHPTIKYDRESIGTLSYEGEEGDEGHGYENEELTILARRHPAQDAAGRFSQGRPGSNRDTSTGRFA